VNDGQQVELGWGAWCEDNEIELHVVDEEKSVAIFLDRANVLKLATALIQSVWENLP
jgi:hypothetical protein